MPDGPVAFANFMAACRKRNLIPFGMFARNTDLSWIADNSGSSDVLSAVGTIDGVNKTFYFVAPLPECLIFNGGLLMTEVIDYTRDETAGTVTFGIAPPAGAVIRAVVGSQSLGTGEARTTPTTTVPSGTINGVNNLFGVTASTVHLSLFLNGLKLREGTGYTFSGGLITMQPGYIPQIGDTLEAEIW